ncbi:MAG: hypothetical protein QM817_32100 [Archangium sp.]
MTVFERLDVEVIRARSPRDHRMVAPAHFTFTPEGGSNVLEVRANELVSPVWYAWWD